MSSSSSSSSAGAASNNDGGGGGARVKRGRVTEKDRQIDRQREVERKRVTQLGCVRGQDNRRSVGNFVAEHRLLRQRIARLRPAIGRTVATSTFVLFFFDGGPPSYANTRGQNTVFSFRAGLRLVAVRDSALFHAIVPAVPPRARARPRRGRPSAPCEHRPGETSLRPRTKCPRPARGESSGNDYGLLT